MNDYQKMFDALKDALRVQRSDYHLTLGQLQKKLTGDGVPSGAIVRFDFGEGLHPGLEDSYRGYYHDLAFSIRFKRRTVQWLLDRCIIANSKVYEGYKGGEFKMDPKTPLWAAIFGNCGRAIIDGRMIGNEFVLITMEVDS